jgi:hypothetical protein
VTSPIFGPQYRTIDQPCCNSLRLLQLYGAELTTQGLANLVDGRFCSSTVLWPVMTILKSPVRAAADESGYCPPAVYWGTIRYLSLAFMSALRILPTRCGVPINHNQPTNYAHNIMTNKLWETRDSRGHPANMQQASTYLRSTAWAHTIAGIIDHSITAAAQIPGRQLPASIVGWLRDVFGVEQQFNVPPLYCTAGVFDHPSVCCKGFQSQACDAVGMVGWLDAIPVGP